MTDFRINVIVDPARAPEGAARVERALAKIEGRAVNTQKLLRDLFAFAGIGVAIRQLFEFADAFTNLQNRLRVVTNSQADLERVTERVLGVANRSRSAFEATAELYSRLSLATRELGRNEDELLAVTESINKAIILSGASAKEANNGLIQLSQGIAANRLGGDELRSTLEQLPVVADVIAKQLGVTRGELRQLGAEGAITADVILKGFENARTELEERFAKTVPTLSQSFTVLRNNVIAFIGELNEASLVTRTLGDAMRFLGENLEIVVDLLVLAGVAFGALKLAPIVQRFFELQAAVKAGTVVLLGSAEAAKQKAIFDRDQAAAALQAAVAETEKTRATILGIEAEQARALVTIESTAGFRAQAEAELLVAAARVRTAQVTLLAAEAENARLLSSAAALDVLFAAQVQETQLLAARAAMTGATEALSAAQAQLAAATSAANLAEAAQRATEGQLSILKAQLTAQTTLQTAAQTRLATATTAATIQSNFLLRAVASLKAAFLGLFRVIAANPIGAIFVALVTVTAGLVLFRDEIKLTEDGVATLGDLFTEFGRQASVALDVILEAFNDVFGGIIDTVKQFIADFDFQFRDIILLVAAVADSIIGIMAGVFAFIGSLILDLPDIFIRGFKLAVNGAIDAIEFLPDVFVGIIKTLAQVFSIFITGSIRGFELLGESAKQALLGNFGAAKEAAEEAAFVIGNSFERATTGIGSRFAKNIAEELDDELIPRLDPGTEKTFTEIGNTAIESFKAAFNANPVTEFVLGLLEGAERQGQLRLAEEAARAAAEAEAKLAEAIGKTAAEFAKRAAQLKLENRVLEESIRFGEVRGEQLREILTLNAKLAEEGLPSLTPDQEKELKGLVARNQELQRFQTLVEELTPLSETLAQKERDLNAAHEQGFLSTVQLAEGMRLLRLEAAEAGTSVADGLTTGLAEALENLRDLQETTNDVVVGAFESIQGAMAQTIQATSEALFEFFDEGKFRAEDLAKAIQSFFFDATQAILRQLEELLAQQALLAATDFVGGLFGAGEGAAESVDDAALLAQRQAVVAQEQLAATTLQTATVGLQTASGVLSTGAATLSTATIALQGGSATLTPAATTLQTGATTLLTAIPGLQAAATTLLAAAQLQVAAGAATGGLGAAASGTGAALAGQPLIVGEEGPEIFTPGQTGSITPTDQTVAALSAGAAMTAAQTTVNVPPPVLQQTVVVTLDPKEVVERGFSDQLVIDATQRNPRAMQSSINSD